MLLFFFFAEVKLLMKKTLYSQRVFKWHKCETKRWHFIMWWWLSLQSKEKLSRTCNYSMWVTGYLAPAPSLLTTPLKTSWEKPSLRSWFYFTWEEIYLWPSYKRVKLGTIFKMCIFWLAKYRCVVPSFHGTFSGGSPQCVCISARSIHPYWYIEMPHFSACPGILCHLPMSKQF